MSTWSGSPAASADDAFRRTVNSYFTLNGTAAGVGGGPGRYDNTTKGYGCGIRFPNVTIPKESVITAATITFVARENQSGTGVKSRFRAQKADNPGQFSDATDFDSRILTSGSVDTSKITSSVAWDDIAGWTVGTSYVSPDLSTIIQEIVNRAGWASGNALVIFWDDFDLRQTVDANYRLGKDYDAGSGYPVLSITYTAPTAKTATGESGSFTEAASVYDPSTAKTATESGTATESAAAAVAVRQTVNPSFAVAAATDDAFRRLTGDAYVVNGNSQGVSNAAGRYNATYNKYGSGMRFTGVSIPQGAQVLSAYLIGVSRYYDPAFMDGTSVKTRLRAQAADNPATFLNEAVVGAATAKADFDARILTAGAVDASKITTSVDWDFAAVWSTNGDTQTSPNIAAIVQEIVNRSGWASGNAMVLFWDDFDGRSTVDNTVRVLGDYENGSPTQLVVTYMTVPGESGTFTESGAMNDLSFVAKTATESGTGSDAAAVKALIDPTPSASAVRTTGAATMLEDWTGDSQGGVEQNHNAFPDGARIRGGPYDGHFLAAYQKGYTHGGINGGIWYQILAPDGAVVVGPTVLRHAGGTQETPVMQYGLPAPGESAWAFGDVNCDYLSNGEIMVSWFERHYSAGEEYTRVWGRWFDCAAGTWSGPAQEITGWQSSGSKYGTIYSPIEVPGIGLVAPEYEIASYSTYPSGLQVRAVKSTDWGRTWSALSTVATVASGPYCDETCFARFSDGQVVAFQRVEPGYDTGNRIRRFVANSTLTSWTLTGNVLTSANGTGWYGFTNRPKIVVDLNDRVWICARAKFGGDAGNSYHVVFYSDDRGVTWTGPLDPADGSSRAAGLPDEVTRGWALSGGFDLMADGTVAHVWSEGQTYSGAGTSVSPYVPERSRVYFRVLTTVTPGRGQETGAGTDSGSRSTVVPTVFATATDAGVVTETAAVASALVSLSASDSGAGTDAGAPAAPLFYAFDEGLFSEGISDVSVTIPLVGNRTLGTFPPGTVVGAYLVRNWRGGVQVKRRAGQAPPVTTATADDWGELTFVGLEAGEYVAFAEALPNRRVFFTMGVDGG